MSNSSILDQNLKATSQVSTLQTSDLINEYVKSKVEYETYSMRAFGYGKTYIDGSYNLLNWKTIDNSLWCEVATEIKYQYTGADSPSGLGRVIQIIISDPSKPTIVDFYMDDPASYDSQIRGDGLDLSKKDNWISNQRLDQITSKKSKCFEIMEQSILAEKQRITAFKEESQQQVEGVTLAAATSRINAVSYANNNCNKANPARGSSSVPYVTFSVDCTNFISHCLLAGGFPMMVGSNGYANCWYFKSLSDRSSSWASANNLFEFLSWNTNNNYPRATSYSSNSNYPYIASPINPNDYKNGDIIQIKYNREGGYGYPNYGHSTIMTGTLFYSGTLSDILITSRTSSTSYNLNRKLREAYPPAPNTNNGSGNCLYRKIKINYSSNY